MTRDGGLDADGDVEMTVAPPVFEFIKAPKLTKWSQPSLVVFLRDRQHSIEPKILEHLAHYFFKTEVFALTDEALRAEIERKAGSLMNDHVPDVEKMFVDRLAMDTSEKGVHARVANYFIAFDKLVEDNGWATWVVRAIVLKVDIQRLASVTHPHVKQDDIALYELIVKRASLQQHYHQIQSDVKRPGSEKAKTAGL
ncbi:hypothetical protein PF010_g1483 [Phytophthora fragariae]|uniref:Uncharacterized protein n=2 Tax=Phytophthora fragariae TaxID=53985 RepID=A0A6G0M1I5_9STRA|nr:hypothetical protein PF010_g1483 [Phytophthora fragariae]KAE9254475.1 hypothetical protein PF004_g1019 [Phytophthora fragariae]